MNEPDPVGEVDLQELAFATDPAKAYRVLERRRHELWVVAMVGLAGSLAVVVTSLDAQLGEPTLLRWPVASPVAPRCGFA